MKSTQQCEISYLVQKLQILKTNVLLLLLDGKCPYVVSALAGQWGLRRWHLNEVNAAM
jgi:hypothetical protein